MFDQGRLLSLWRYLRWYFTSPTLIVSGNFVGGTFRIPFGISSMSSLIFILAASVFQQSFSFHHLSSITLNRLIRDDTQLLLISFDVVRPRLLPITMPILQRLVLLDW